MQQSLWMLLVTVKCWRELHSVHFKAVVVFFVLVCHEGVNLPRRCHASHTDTRDATWGSRFQTGEITLFSVCAKILWLCECLSCLLLVISSFTLTVILLWKVSDRLFRCWFGVLLNTLCLCNLSRICWNYTVASHQQFSVLQHFSAMNLEIHSPAITVSLELDYQTT